EPFRYLAERFNPCHGNLCDNPLPLLTRRFPKPFRQASFAIREGSRFETRFHLRSSVYIGLVHVKSDIVGQIPSRCFSVEVWRGKCQLRCRPPSK
ncbi:hypothetical protein AVEN_51385-1, partial [Araneus ventricosus]